MDTDNMKLEDTSKSTKQETILDKICNMQWLKHSTHLPHHTKPRLNKKKVQHLKNDGNEEHKIKEITSNENKDEGQLIELKIEEASSLEKDEEQVEDKSSGSKLDEKMIRTSLINDRICDTNITNVTDGSQSLEISSKSSFESSLVQKLQYTSQNGKEKHCVTLCRKYPEPHKEAFQTQQCVCDEDEVKEVSCISENKNEVNVKQQCVINSNNNALDFLVKEISQIHLSMSMKDKNEGKGNDGTVLNKYQELAADASTHSETIVINKNVELFKEQIHKTDKKDVILENNEEEFFSDDNQCNKSNKNCKQVQNNKHCTQSNYNTTNCSGPSKAMYMELNKQKYKLNDTNNMQIKKGWTHNFTYNRSFFNSNNTRINRPLVKESREEIQQTVPRYSNDLALMEEEDKIITNYNNNADVRHHGNRICYKYSKEGIKRIEIKEDGELLKGIEKSTSSHTKKMMEHENDKPIITANEKKELNTSNYYDKQFNRYKNLNRNSNEHNLNYLERKSRMLQQCSNININNQSLLNKDKKSENTMQSTVNCFSNDMITNTSINNNFTEVGQSLISDNVQTSNAMCSHQTFYSQKPHNTHFYDELSFVNYPAFHYNNNSSIGQEGNYMYSPAYLQLMCPINWNGCYPYPIPLQVCHPNCNTFDNQPTLHARMNSWPNYSQICQQSLMDLPSDSSNCFNNSESKNDDCMKDSEDCTSLMVSPKACMLSANELSKSESNSSEHRIIKVQTNSNDVNVGYSKQSNLNFTRCMKDAVNNTRIERQSPHRTETKY